MKREKRGQFAPSALILFLLSRSLEHEAEAEAQGDVIKDRQAQIDHKLALRDDRATDEQVDRRAVRLDHGVVIAGL